MKCLWFIHFTSLDDIQLHWNSHEKSVYIKIKFFHVPIKYSANFCLHDRGFFLTMSFDIVTLNIDHNKRNCLLQSKRKQILRNSAGIFYTYGFIFNFLLCGRYFGYEYLISMIDRCSICIFYFLTIKMRILSSFS